MQSLQQSRRKGSSSLQNAVPFFLSFQTSFAASQLLIYLNMLVLFS